MIPHPRGANDTPRLVTAVVGALVAWADERAEAGEDVDELVGRAVVVRRAAARRGRTVELHLVRVAHELRNHRLAHPAVAAVAPARAPRVVEEVLPAGRRVAVARELER